MPIPNERPCSLMELTADTCRWPVGDPGQPGFYFCGAQPADDKPYCWRHDNIAHQKPVAGPRRPWVEWRRG
jgi:GcrA cell cycle regulator